MGLVSLLVTHGEKAKKRRVNYRLGIGVQRAKTYPKGRYVVVLPEEIQQKAKFHAGDIVELLFDAETKDAKLRKSSNGWKLCRYKDGKVLRVTFPFYPEAGYPDIGHIREPKDVRVTRDGIEFSLDYSN